MLENMVPITCWWGKYDGMLEPNFEIPVVFEDDTYPSLRHALEASKTQDKRLRKALTEILPHAAVLWGKNYTFPSPFEFDAWHKEVKEIALLLTAQKFGVIYDPDAGHELTKLRTKLGFWLTLTNGRALRYENDFCDVVLGYCTCERHLHRNSSRGFAPGENILGTQTMIVRQRLLKGSYIRDFKLGTCDWCHETRREKNGKPKITKAEMYILYFKNNALVCRSFCLKHFVAEKQEARRRADNGAWFAYDINDKPSEISFYGVQSELPIVVHRLGARRGGFSSEDNNFSNRGSGFQCNPCTPPTPDVKERWGSLVILNNKTVSHVISCVER